jgi:hypothetical protein
MQGITDAALQLHLITATYNSSQPVIVFPSWTTSVFYTTLAG